MHYLVDQHYPVDQHYSDDKNLTVCKHHPVYLASRAVIATIMICSPSITLSANVTDENIANTHRRITTAEAHTGIEEVMVTAQKIEQKLSDVPITVSVLSEADIQRNAGNGIESLLLSVPGLTSRGNGSPRERALFLRGVGTISFSIASEPSVGTFIDGVPLAAPGNAFTDLYDVERIEVLRGPQGNLFGKNTSAGLVQIITKKPTKTLEKEMAFSAFNQDYYKVNGSISGAINTDVLGRINGFYNTYDGNVFNETLNQQVNGNENYGIRSQVEWRPNPNTTLRVTGDYAEQTLTGGVNVPISAAIDNESGDIQTLSPIASELNGENFNGTATRRIRQNLAAHTEGQDYGASFHAEFTPNTHHSLHAITALRHWSLGGDENGQTADQDSLAFPAIVGATDVNNFQDTAYDTFSQEFRFQTATNQTVEYTLGLFYYQTDSERFFSRLSVRCNRSTLGDNTCPEATNLPVGTNFARLASYNPATQRLNNPNDFRRFQQAFDPNIFSANTSIAFIDSHLKSSALFGQGTWHLTEYWRAIGGLRYTHDTVSFEQNRTTALVNDGENAEAADDFGNAESTFAGVRPQSLSLQGKTTTDNLSGKVALQYDWSDDLTGYVSYARGYKGPGYNAFFNLSDGQQGPIEAETSNYYELGFRSSLLNHSLSFGTSVYYAEFSNFQTNALVVLDGVNTSTFTNAGEISTRGLDIDVRYQPFNGLVINSAYAFNLAQVEQFVSNPITGETTAESGSALPFAPKHQFNIGLNYSIPLRKLNVDMFANLSYSSEQYSNFGERFSERLGEYTYGNIGITATTQDNRTEVTFQVKNVGNQTLPRRRGNAGNAGHIMIIDADSERLIGLTARIRF